MSGEMMLHLFDGVIFYFKAEIDNFLHFNRFFEQKIL